MRTRFVRAFAAGVALAAASSGLAACGGSSTAADAADTLTVGIPVKPQSLNPGKNGNGGQNIVQWLAYEPLIRMKSDGSFEPGLATDWAYVGEGNTAFTMTIRTDAKFADGTAVTSAAVADSVNYYLANPGPLSHWLSGITAAEATDESTVVISLDKPNPNLPQVFSQVANWGDVISPAGLSTPDKLTSETFGAGAYVLDPERTIDGDHYTFDKNEQYWNADEVGYDTVVIKVLADPNAALQALRSNQIQVDLNANAAIAAQTGADIDVVEGPGFVQTTFLMDRAGEVTPALGDVRVRRALNLAVDREAIATALGAGYEPTSQIAPEGNSGFDAALDDEYDYDPEAAKTLLAEAGYGDGFTVELLSTSVLGIDTTAQALAQQWAGIGVQTEITSVGVDLNQLIADMASKQYPVVAFNTGTDMYTNALQNFASPVSPLNPFASTGDEVLGAFDALSAASAEEQDARAVDLNTAVTEQAWFVPVARTGSYMFTRGIDDVGTIGKAGAMDVLDWKPAS